MAKQYIPVIRQTITGLKCDHPGCGYRNDDIPYADYPLYVNAPCPKCGSNLLTEADFITTTRMMMTVEKINRWCNKWLPTFVLKWLSPDHRKSGIKEYSVELDGTGVPVIHTKNVCSDGKKDGCCGSCKH